MLLTLLYPPATATTTSTTTTTTTTTTPPPVAPPPIVVSGVPATSAQLSQAALQIAATIQQSLIQGQRFDTRVALMDMCAAVIALAEADLGATGGVIILSQNYSAVTPTTTPVVTVT